MKLINNDFNLEDVIPRLRHNPEIFSDKFTWNMVSILHYRILKPTGNWMIEMYPDKIIMFVEAKDTSDNTINWYHEDAFKLEATPIVFTFNKEK